jgi:hypothetical protein
VTGVQPRPLRYQGRLNRRGRNERKMVLRGYVIAFDQMVEHAMRPAYPRDVLEPDPFGLRAATRMVAAEDVREGDPVAIDDFGRAYRAGGTR